MDPLRASIETYQRSTPGVEVVWDTRSLADFGEGDLDALLEYDLVVFDHPYCGEISERHAMLDLGTMLSEAEKDAFARDSLGPSWASYQADGGIWGLPLDAAAQVASFRPDLMANLGEDPPRTLDAVLTLASKAQQHGMYVGFPHMPTDAVCTFLSLCASAGFPVGRDRSAFPDHQQTRLVLEAMHRLASVAHPGSGQWNPIRCYDHMSQADDVVYVPYAFGYTNYSRSDQTRPLKFCDIPGFQTSSCDGAVLGGAGIGIPARSRHPEAALQYARYLCAPRYQAAAYFRNGGQPASYSAWTQPGNDEACNGFFSGTLATMTNAYLRPTFAGYLDHFRAAGSLIASYLHGNCSADHVSDWLRRDFLS